MRIQGSVKSLGINADGLVEEEDQKYYVPYTAPGDVIEFEVIRQKKRKDIHLHQVLTPSPLRGVPPCSHFGSCGGCALLWLGRRRDSHPERDGRPPAAPLFD